MSSFGMAAPARERCQHLEVQPWVRVPHVTVWVVPAVAATGAPRRRHPPVPRVAHQEVPRGRLQPARAGADQRI